ncbi:MULTISPECIES: UDP-N-acetylmuramoyl-tripeptide--D-alanyl-D-alanine ligase [Aerococcus]|uniref:UDP-N-acetylmuramoyl-tripeptide--D-alanyl-D-alanine ligase n=1 Tax=Aerococcus sanguinicola TaxID=119206 RepID=A0A5N1GIJ7_9LACT|nr:MULTISPECIES: UDP-N-acetylmuramoyl-tripeptide--D-alanyl-D-alanine ligase [Aerococcus]KAA9300592.1 UDP-N-acetylmuramoyl-tripeptide--D-alanyl-D-alanine ligase [Aerococcus sanguinicola]MDK6369606.1 UDP-N-acetylmuramoyl-tripeptide--D-alanyl-D-alanine ligase [Aerococcus sp. UMB9870]MDK6680111.1 UDP-N-acetylmuramoyl-tripeptide--D-alanyl-D-alanine ligase [Aerococcus sp. UMB8608]MDK6686272.1 UDP-N-acetylmuramoyl-tripeptide--D-alanyl-D-alanine ligase [Aerococcus sp. UMB8623]MDK6940192.1 UDP-N-acetyl
MKKLALNEIARAVQGELQAEDLETPLIQHVVFDARQAQPGSLFVPLMGQRDGHDFAQQALDNGAVAAFWSKDPAQAPAGLALIQVADTLAALQDLAAYYLSLVQPKLVAITGSSGKTTTKDMTAACLAVAYRVHKTQGNYNNEIGVPITILEMPETTEVLVLEMGMSNFGEIHDLSLLAKPDLAVITMIGEDHLEFLKTKANIAKAKLEILDGLKEGGTFIYPGEEDLITSQLDDIREDIETLSVGLTEDQDVYALDIIVDQYQTHFSSNLSPAVQLTIPVSGRYNVVNALDACAVSYRLGLSIEQIQEALAHFQMTANRTAWVDGINESQVLDDTYNASPSAMKAVISNFVQVPRAGDAQQGRKLYVLADMLELGPESAQLHASVADALTLQDQDQVLLYGLEMQALYERLLAAGQARPDQVHYFKEDKGALVAWLEDQTRHYDQILVKGSHGMGLLEVVDALRRKDTDNQAKED